MDSLSELHQLKTLLLLNNISGLGCAKINQLIRKTDNIAEILHYSNQDLLALGLNQKQANSISYPSWGYADNQITLAEKNNIELISIYNNNYPELLKQIYDPPIILYVKGNKKILSAEQIAVVGTRRPSLYGCQMAEYFSNEIACYGYVITSGFAIGIDIIAHLTASKKNMPTVVVLGTSLDYVYPDRHKKYVEQIIASGGVIVSEFGFTTFPHPSCFPRRNRIISGLSKGVLVVEAARKSGSLITARCALEQSREVFAVPGNISNTQALGCLDLIVAGAKLTIDISNIIEELAGIKSNYPRNKQATILGADNAINNDLSKLDKNQKKLLLSLAGGSVDFDSIVCGSNLSAEEVAAQLVQLEIMGYVVTVPGGYAKAL